MSNSFVNLRVVFSLRKRASYQFIAMMFKKIELIRQKKRVHITHKWILFFQSVDLIWSQDRKKQYFIPFWHQIPAPIVLEKNLVC